MDRHWHLTWTTYGTWLPGDERGFVGKQVDVRGKAFIHNIPGTSYDAKVVPLHSAMAERLKCPPIYLVTAQAEALIEQFQETASHRCWKLLAAAVMRSHVHLVVGVPGDPEPETLLQAFKSYGSRKLNRMWTRPASDTWWTESGSKRKKSTEEAIVAAVCYVLDQPSPLVIWLHPDWRYLLDRQRYDRTVKHGERGT
jgi:REP element-mobilizing transposase RayT